MSTNEEEKGISESNNATNESTNNALQADQDVNLVNVEPPITSDHEKGLIQPIISQQATKRRRKRTHLSVKKRQKTTKSAPNRVNKRSSKKQMKNGNEKTVIPVSNTRKSMPIMSRCSYPRGQVGQDRISKTQLTGRPRSRLNTTKLPNKSEAKQRKSPTIKSNWPTREWQNRSLIRSSWHNMDRFQAPTRRSGNTSAVASALISDDHHSFSPIHTTYGIRQNNPVYMGGYGSQYPFENEYSTSSSISTATSSTSSTLSSSLSSSSLSTSPIASDEEQNYTNESNTYQWSQSKPTLAKFDQWQNNSSPQQKTMTDENDCMNDQGIDKEDDNASEHSSLELYSAPNKRENNENFDLGGAEE